MFKASASHKNILLKTESDDLQCLCIFVMIVSVNIVYFSAWKQKFNHKRNKEFSLSVYFYFTIICIQTKRYVRIKKHAFMTFLDFSHNIVLEHF